MISVQLYLAFGYGEQAEVWGSSVELERLFRLGEKTQIVLRDSSGDDSEQVVTIDCEVGHIDYTDSGEPYVFIYHEDLINDLYSELLEAANWERMSEEDEDSILDVLDYAPPVAALHDLILVVGDYEIVDKEGYPSGVKVWHRVIEPDDPSVPVFGEKFYSHVILANGDNWEDEAFEEDAEDPEPTEEQLQQIAELLNAPEMLELKDREEPTELEPEIEMLMVSETIDLESGGTPEDGYPVLTFYTAKVGYGEANIGVWCRSVEPYTELDMIADGWQLLPKESLNLEDFRLKERVELALNTFVTMVEDETGTRFIERYEIVDPSLVTEEQFALIPPALQEMSSGIQELDKDFENIDSYLNDWLMEVKEEDEDSKP
jgi:hypothetical protein